VKRNYTRHSARISVLLPPCCFSNLIKNRSLNQRKKLKPLAAGTLAYFNRNQYLGGFDYHTVEIYTIRLDGSGLVAASGPSIKAEGKAYGTGRKGSIEWKDGDLYWNQYGIYSDGDEPVFARVLKTGVIEPETVSSGEYGDLRFSNEVVYKLGQAGTSLKIAATAGDTDDRPGYLPGQPWRASGTGPQLSYRRKGIRQYELTDHLGNVRAVIGDRLEEKTDEDGQTAYAPQLLSATDYFPFGMQMPGRVVVNGEGYRYGFNGMEKENAVNEDGYTSTWRQYSSWSARWMSLDPEMKKYPSQSPYVSMDNSPIWKHDPEGDAAPIVIAFYYGGAALIATVTAYYIATESPSFSVNYEWVRSDGKVFQCYTEQTTSSDGWKNDFRNPEDPKGRATLIGAIFISSLILIDDKKEQIERLSKFDFRYNNESNNFEDAMTNALNNISPEARILLLNYVTDNMLNMTEEKAVAMNNTFSKLFEYAEDGLVLTDEQISGLINIGKTHSNFLNSWFERIETDKTE
jgi:RHS repeat-associated protein